MYRKQKIPVGVKFDYKILRMYARNKASSYKLQKSVYEMYDVEGNVGNFAAVIYQWTGNPFPLPACPHGNTKWMFGEEVKSLAVCTLCKHACRSPV